MSSQAIYWIFSLAATGPIRLPSPRSFPPSVWLFHFGFQLLSCWSILWHFWVNINKFLIHMIKCVEWWLKLGFDSTQSSSPLIRISCWHCSMAELACMLRDSHYMCVCVLALQGCHFVQYTKFNSHFGFVCALSPSFKLPLSLSLSLPLSLFPPPPPLLFFLSFTARLSCLPFAICLLHGQ